MQCPDWHKRSVRHTARQDGTCCYRTSDPATGLVRLLLTTRKGRLRIFPSSRCKSPSFEGPHPMRMEYWRWRVVQCPRVLQDRFQQFSTRHQYHQCKWMRQQCPIHPVTFATTVAGTNAARADRLRVGSVWTPPAGRKAALLSRWPRWELTS